MPVTQNGNDNSSIQHKLDRITARRIVDEMLAGSGLRVRELANELVITRPREPENGRIYVEYGNGYVTYQRKVTDALGPLQGYASEEDEGESHIGAAEILAALDGLASRRSRHEGMT